MTCKACDNDHAIHMSRVICQRMRSSTKQWYEKPAYSLPAEVKAMKRRSALDPKPKDKLPMPTLAAISKRLAGAELDAGQLGVFTGPRAAEEWVKARREELGLSNEMQPELTVV